MYGIRNIKILAKVGKKLGLVIEAVVGFKDNDNNTDRIFERCKCIKEWKNWRHPKSLGSWSD